MHSFKHPVVKNEEQQQLVGTKAHHIISFYTKGTLTLQEVNNGLHLHFTTSKIILKKITTNRR